MPIILSVEHGQGLRDIEVEEFQRRKCPKPVEQAIDQR